MGRPEQKWMNRLSIVRQGESAQNVSKQAELRAGQFDYSGRVRDAGRPTEFGKLVQLQEAENQIVTH